MRTSKHRNLLRMSAAHIKLCKPCILVLILYHILCHFVKNRCRYQIHLVEIMNKIENRYEKKGISLIESIEKSIKTRCG